MANSIDVAVRQASQSARANELAREALAVDQRPWIESSNPQVSQNFRSGTTHFGVAGFYIDLGILTINRGRAPATAVKFNAEIFLTGPGRQNAAERLAAFCDDWKRKLAENYDGEAIFRDGQLPMSHTLFLPQQDIDAVINPQGERPFIARYALGCVTYRSPHFEGPKQTRFSYMICEIDPAGNTQAINTTTPDWWTRRVALVGPGTVIAD